MFSGALGFIQSRPSKVKKRSARKTSAKILSNRNKHASRAGATRFRAAEIEFEDCACDAVKAMQGQRFLVRDVPRIPVPDCDKSNCRCSYVRYNDRRLWTEDRRAFFGLKTSHYVQGDSQERRKVQDRRTAAECADSEPDSLENIEAWLR